MKSLIIVYCALLWIICLPLAFGSFHDAKVDDFTQDVAGVSTGSGTYEAGVILSLQLWNNSLLSVKTISSNISSDSPSADNYTAVSRLLTVSGLADNVTRTLSVTYEVESATVQEHSGVSVFFTVYIWFWIFVGLGLAAGAVYAFFR